MEKARIERHYHASLDQLWEAFTEPDKLSQWWAPEGMTPSNISVDLKSGGLFHFCFRGEIEFWGRGIYQEIISRQKLSYLDSFSNSKGEAVPPSAYGLPGEDIQETLIEFEFEETEGGSLLTVFMDNPYDEALTDEMLKGWNSMFDRLGAYFTRNIEH